MIEFTSMRQSQLFSKTRREAPKDEVAKNAELLIRGGYIHKEMAGVYSFLPLGLIVLNKIIQIIREEMNEIGGEEILLASLQQKDTWQTTDRWDDKKVDNWFKTKLKNDTELGLGFTHEEPLTALMREHIRSYKDLPRYAYQFQTKFRNETRAKSGIMRSREFIMKDLYSFSKSQKEHDEFYEKAKESYITIFQRIGIGEKTYVTFASGGSFSKFSHEFQTITDAGEDIIYISDEKKIALNKEVMNDEGLAAVGVKKEDLREAKAVEVGNIFSLGTRFSEAIGLTYVALDGSKKPVIMGSYGIGPARLMGTVVELFSDDAGIVWPKSIAPFDIHLIEVPCDESTNKAATKLYENLKKAGVSVLYDDRDARAGEKFSDSDLIGIPTRIVISKKTIEEGMLEVKSRAKGHVTKMTESQLVASIKKAQ